MLTLSLTQSEFQFETLEDMITFQVIFRYEDPKKIIGRAWIGLACIPVCQNILKHVAHAFLSVWPVHEPDLVDAEAYLGRMAGPRVRLKNQLSHGEHTSCQ